MAEVFSCIRSVTIRGAIAQWAERLPVNFKEMAREQPGCFFAASQTLACSVDDEGELQTP